MNCKEALRDYKTLKSQEQGLNHKLNKLDLLLQEGSLDLLDKLLLESQRAREQLAKIEHSIKHLESNFKFLNRQGISISQSQDRGKARQLEGIN